MSRLSSLRQGPPDEYCTGHNLHVQAKIEFYLMRFADVIALCCIFGTVLPNHSVRRPLHLYLGALDEIKNNDVETTSVTYKPTRRFGSYTRLRLAQMRLLKHKN